MSRPVLPETLAPTCPSRAAVFLDRDGVLNRAPVDRGLPRPPASLAEFAILPGVAAALRALKRRGFALIVVTNQPDIARGTMSLDLVSNIHRELERRLALDAIMVCPHDDADECACRKPAPGLLLEAARAHGIDLPSSFMVGDRWRDIEAGRRAGCRTLWIDRGYHERPAENYHHRVASLPEAAALIRESRLEHS